MEMERVGEKSKRSRILLSRSRSRSPIKRKQKKKPETATGSGGKWAHDKFQETLNSPEKLEHSPAFGSHWSQIRSERSKERDRRSDSSGSRYELLNKIVWIRTATPCPSNQLIQFLWKSTSETSI